jgi:hypothetical protein
MTDDQTPTQAEPISPPSNTGPVDVPAQAPQQMGPAEPAPAEPFEHPSLGTHHIRSTDPQLIVHADEDGPKHG